MIRVNNRETINKLAKVSFKGNKRRNRLVIVAIVLATFMLTTVFSLGISYYQSVGQRNIMMSGSDYNAFFDGPTAEQVAQAREHPKIEHAGVQVGCATLIDYQGESISTTLIWSDEVNWQEQMLPAFEYIKGTYPKGTNEVLLSKKALDKMGIDDPQVGMPLDLTYIDHSRENQRQFTLSGIINDYSNRDRGFVSESFYEASNAEQSDITQGRLYISLKNPLVSGADIEALEADLKIERPQVIFADTEVRTIVLQVVGALTVVILLIMISAYLFIYNILYISVAKEIRFYGLLKTIGTTSKQIRSLIYQQIIYLSLIGIPLGLLLGAGVSLAIVPALLKSVSVYETGMSLSFSPLIYLGSALFAFATVFISCRRPAKIAGDISPIEAAKYISGSKRKSRRTLNGGKLTQMAWRNIFRDKKRAFLVFLSLFLGLTSFLCIATLIHSNQAERILGAVVEDDIVLANKTSGGDETEQVFDADFLARLNDVEGIKEIHSVTATNGIIPRQPVFEEFIKGMYDVMMNEPYEDGMLRMAERPQDFYSVLTGIDDAEFIRICEDYRLDLELADFKAGKICIAHASQYDFDSLKKIEGESFIFSLDQEQQHETKIGAVIMGNVLGAQYNAFYPNMFYSQAYIDQLVADPLIDNIQIIFDQSYDRTLDRELKELASINSEIDMESKIDRLENMQQSENQLAIFGGGLSIILAFLGLMNYSNLMTTSVTDRKREFASLQSIGMTEKQMSRLLLYEGLGYGLISLVSVATLGVAITYGVYTYTKGYNLSMSIPLIPVIAVFAVVFLICLFVPLMVYRITQKGTIMEQLRELE